MSKSNKKLQEQNREKFARIYTNTLNISEAYRQVFPNASNGTAKVNGFRLFKQPETQALIQKYYKEKKDKFELNEKTIIEKLKSIVEVDPATYFNNHFTVKSLDQIPAEYRKLIKNIKVTQAGITIELPDKVEALTKIGQHIGMFQQGNKDENRYLVRIYVVPAINYSIQLPDKTKIAQELINEKLNKYNGNGSGKKILKADGK